MTAAVFERGTGWKSDGLVRIRFRYRRNQCVGSGCLVVEALWTLQGVATIMERVKMCTPRDAAKILGVSYPTIKQWIYRGRVKAAKTQGGHYRIPETEIDRLLPTPAKSAPLESRRKNFRKISGRNQLIGRVIEVKISGLMAQVTLSIGEQYITSIITADAVRELRLKKGQLAAALIKSTEVMIVLP